jgi:outer membrane receptor protein involved in Fe transport
MLTQDVLTASGDILRSRGTISLGDRDERRRALYNGGAFVQSQWNYDFVSLTGGLRFDYHNIYGVNASGRAGAVFDLGAMFTLKALYGSSFKPPTAEQLFTSAATTGDILGNAAVKSQFAHNFELALVSRLPNDLGEASINMFVADIVGRVAYQQRALFRSAQNILDEWVVGGELESRLKIARPVMLNLSASVARTVIRQKSAFLAVLPPVTNELYPLVQVHGIVDVAIPFADLKASLEVSLIGPRAASQENAVKRAGAYELPSYLYTAISLSTVQQFIKGSPTSLALRLENFPNLRWYEPGFGGIDTPNLGLNATLTVSQQF